MQTIRLDLVVTQRLKSAGANMQCDEAVTNSQCECFRQHGRIEVQARGRRSNCTRPARVDRLVALPVGGPRLPSEVRWQWHFTMCHEKRLYQV